MARRAEAGRMHSRAPSPPPHPTPLLTRSWTQHFAFSSMHTYSGAAQQHRAHLRQLPPRGPQTFRERLPWQLPGSWQPSPFA